MTYTVNGSSIHLESGNRIDFDYPIDEVVDCGKTLVVMIEPDPGVPFNENVYGVDKCGQIAWQIQRRSHVYKDSPYTGMLKDDSNVKVFNWDGETLTLNPSDGAIIKVEYGK